MTTTSTSPALLSATDLARTAARNVVPEFSAASPARERAADEVATLVVQVLSVLGGLIEPTTLDRAYQYRASDGQVVTAMPAAERVPTLVDAARQAASFAIPTHYASSGGTRQAVAHRMVEAIMNALFGTGLLNITQADLDTANAAASR